MASETITRNDLTAILNEVLPPELTNTIAYTTTIPTSDNLNGLKFVLCDSEPITKYNGSVYLIKE